MTGARCACGFAELADEELIDHLLGVFEPDDHIGHDGLVHEERDRLTCACGFTGTTPDEFDAHVLKAFAPGDGIGRDGRRHQSLEAGDGA